MARADRRSVRTRTRTGAPKAAAAGKKANVNVEDTLFFSRIRNHAKWVFVFLAITFASSFVLFGVGTGFGGLQDILLQNNGVAGGPSESSARERIAENPKDAQAYRDLATALQNQQKPEESIAPLAKYVELEPSDTDSQRELAALYLQQADQYRIQAQLAQLGLQNDVPGAVFQPSSESKIGNALATDPINDALSSRHNTALNAAVTKMTEALTKRRCGLQGGRRGPAERLCDPVRARPDGRDGERPADRGRRLQALPRARPRGPVGPGGQGTDRAARRTLGPCSGGVDSARPEAAANTGEAMNFEIKTDELGDDAYVISLAGEVDLYTAPEFKQQLLDVISQGGKNVIVDFSNTTFIDSTTLGVLVGGVKRLRTNDGQLSLVCSDRNITKIFEITGLDRVFTIYSTRDEAVDQLKTSGPAA